MHHEIGPLPTPPLLLTSGGQHWIPVQTCSLEDRSPRMTSGNMYSLQAGNMYPTGMLSCFFLHLFDFQSMFFTKVVILRIVCSLCLFVNTDLWFNPQNWKEFTASFHCLLDDLQTGKFSAFPLLTEMKCYIHSYWENKRNFKEKSCFNY